MKKVFITLALLLILGLAYLTSPYIAIYNFVNALQVGDKQTIQQHMNFPAVRASVRSQVNNAMKNNLKKNKYNPLAIISITASSTIINGLVECILTPAGLSEIIQYGEFHNPLEALNGYKIPIIPKPTQPKQDKKYNFDMVQSIGFTGFNEFTVKLIVKQSKKPVVLVFVRQDFSWLLQDIDMSGVLDSYVLLNF
ncbi:DUF2939 domain-containing protein [Candidatus Hepatincola sp. Pdp]